MNHGVFDCIGAVVGEQGWKFDDVVTTSGFGAAVAIRTTSLPASGSPGRPQARRRRGRADADG
jgi:hypothetical protein